MAAARDPAPTPTPTTSARITDVLVRCVLVFERDGDRGLERELAAAGELEPTARKHFEALRTAGLLLPPEQPEHIGPYRVLERLGSGGMGAVFLCEQLTPIRRQVAVKLLRAGMETREILARFAIERQTLSLLNHPGIAKIFDAGTADSGRPFLVMEYVAGQQLNRYCDERQLTTRQRLELFVRVCEAVQHAHHKGIIHRDLKPGNVLVVDREGAAAPVVIDFGVAKSIGTELTGATLMTLPGHMLGTPEYMSPEQATNQQDIDTRTDVYSLGVILYELLTGTLPIDSQRLRSHDDVARVLRDYEPPTPSTRITTLGEAAAASMAERRGTDPPGLKRLLRGDLDWIVVKAIEKDRARRYGMPGELAADVLRHLRDEPVTAGRPGAWYRFTKYWARHRLQVTAAAFVLAALAAGMTVSLVFWRTAERNSQASASSLDYALRAIDELVQVGDSDLVAVPHLEKVRRNLLERSIAFYRGFLEQVQADDPRLAPRIANAQVRLGGMQVQLGQTTAAIPNLVDGLASLERLGPSTALPIPTTARALQQLSEAHERSGDRAAAAADLERARRLLEPALAAAAAERAVELRLLLLRTRRSEGELRSLAGDPAAADSFAAAVELGAPFAADPERFRAQLPDVIYAGADQARQLQTTGQRDEAIAQLVALRTLWERARADSPDAAADWRLTTVATELAALFARCDRAADALDMLSAAAQAYERLVRDHADVLTYRTGLATTRSEYGAALMRRWQFADGERITMEAERDHAAALELAPEDPLLLNHAAFAAISVAQCELELQKQRVAFDLDRARAATERAFVLIERLERTAAGAQLAQRARLEALRLRAYLAADPNGDDAIADLRAGLALADRLVAADPAAVPNRERRLAMRLPLAAALLRRGEVAAAREQAAIALDEQTAMRAQVPSRRLFLDRRRDVLTTLARCDAALGDVDAVLATVAAWIGLAEGFDWRGLQDAATLLVQLADGPLREHARRGELLARGREVINLAHQDGVAYERAEGANVSPAMIALMRANTWEILVRLEQIAGDVTAEATALGEIAACHAAALANSDNERAEARLRDSCAKWGDALLRAARTEPTATALQQMNAWFAGRAAALGDAAAIAGRFCRAHPDAVAVREAGRRLLQAAVAAGMPAPTDDQPDLRPLRGAR